MNIIVYLHIFLMTTRTNELVIAEELLKSCTLRKARVSFPEHVSLPMALAESVVLADWRVILTLMLVFELTDAKCSPESAGVYALIWQY